MDGTSVTADDAKMRQAQQLHFRGAKLELSNEFFGEMRDSIDVLNDSYLCRRRMNEDGYLLFRGLIDRDSVLEARREILLKYAIIGEIDNVNHPVLDGIYQRDSFISNVNLIAFTESVCTGRAYQGIVQNSRLTSFYENFLSSPVRCFDFKWLRFVRPGEGCGIHCDIVYVGRGTRNPWSTWIPIGDVSRVEGALMVLEGSHKAKQLESYWSKDADHDKLGWLSVNPRELQDEIGGRWLTTDFKAGDVICFSAYLVHATLDNCSPLNRCRLTTDVRYQSANEPLDERWNGNNANPHGGDRKVFLPGLGKWNNNQEFEEEWKRVDRSGRLLIHGGINGQDD